ncbi:hypothetical protein DFS33DRAFT_1361280 [Desarmillaria ectypa]|nr:hypothetical protein DFS33DRAFT_1361280 [Desarmillaria ectypa]
MIEVGLGLATLSQTIMAMSGPLHSRHVYDAIARRYPALEIVDEKEQQKFQDIIDSKKRGKGSPTKSKGKAFDSLPFSPSVFFFGFFFSPVVQRTPKELRRNGRCRPISMLLNFGAAVYILVANCMYLREMCASNGMLSPSSIPSSSNFFDQTVLFLPVSRTHSTQLP